MSISYNNKKYYSRIFSLICQYGLSSVIRGIEQYYKHTKPELVDDLGYTIRWFLKNKIRRKDLRYSFDSAIILKKILDLIIILNNLKKTTIIDELFEFIERTCIEKEVNESVKSKMTIIPR